MRSIRLFSRVILFISGTCWVQLSAQTISWWKIEGPYSGAIALLTVDPAGDIIVATDVSGVYRSTDGGGSWQSVNNGLGLQHESVLIEDSLNNIYAGDIRSGLYASTNGGTSWSKTNLVGDVQCAAAISGNRICAGGRQTVSISNDHGTTWSSSQVTTDTRVEVASIAEDSSGNIYAGLQSYHPEHPPAPAFGGGVYISSDSGKTWGSYGLATTTISSIVVSEGGKVFILTGASIYSAAQKSNKWTEDDAGIQYTGISIATLLSDNLGEAVAVTNTGIFVYRDSTASWESVTPGVSLASITSGFYNPKGTSYAGTDRNGVFCMRSSTSAWVQCGIDPRPVTSMWSASWDKLFAGTEDGVFERDLLSGGWLRVSDGLSHSIVYQLYFSALSKRLYASTSGGLFYLPDKGNYWNIIAQQCTYNIVEAPNGDRYAALNGGILKAVGGDDLWAPVQTIGIPATNIYCLALDASNDLCAGTSLNGIFISTDGGTFWTQAGVSTPLIFYSVKTIEIDNERRIFAGTDTSGAYYSDDLGVSWIGIPSINGKSVTGFLVNYPSMYFAGTSDHGVFVSADRGLTWHSANNGLTDSSVISLIVDQQDHLYAGTNKGLFMGTGIMTRIDEKNKVPSTFSLNQNFPNPFNPTTVISYGLSVYGRVTLIVYDLLGREVKTLVNEVKRPGRYQVTVDGIDLPSGVYLYRLATGSYVETKKMILIK